MGVPPQQNLIPKVFVVSTVSKQKGSGNVPFAYLTYSSVSCHPKSTSLLLLETTREGEELIRTHILQHDGHNKTTMLLWYSTKETSKVHGINNDADILVLDGSYQQNIQPNQHHRQ